MVLPIAPSNYGPPQISFDGLDQLGSQFFKGAEQRQKYDLSRAFKDGLPKKPDGTVDIQAMTETLAQHGAPDIAVLQDLVDRGAVQDAARNGPFGSPQAGMGAPAPSMGPQGAPGAGAAPQPRAPAQSGSLPPSLASPALRREAVGGNPIYAANEVSPLDAPQGKPEEGAQTVRGMATEIFGGRDVSQLIPRFAQAFKLDPDAPLTPAQEAQLKPVMGRSLTAMTERGQGQGSPQAPASPSQPAGGVINATLANQIAQANGYQDYRSAIIALRQREAALAGNPRGKEAATAARDLADTISKSLMAPSGVEEAGRQQSNLDRTFNEGVRQFNTTQEKPVSLTPGTELVNPKTGQPVASNASGLLDKSTIDAMARQAMSGDTSVFTNLGRGAQGAENVIAVRKRIAELNSGSGESGSEQAMRNAEFFGVKSGQRTLGTRSANIELAATEFKQVLPVVREASKAVSRTSYPDLNRIIQSYEEKTGDPNIVKFGGGVNTLVNLYARAISPSGTPTVSDKDHARLILNRAWSQGQFDAAVDMMGQEIDAALSSPDKVRDAMRERFLGGQQGGPKSAGDRAPTTSNQQPSGGKPQTVIQNGHTYTLQPDGTYK